MNGVNGTNKTNSPTTGDTAAVFDRIVGLRGYEVSTLDLALAYSLLTGIYQCTGQTTTSVSNSPCHVVTTVQDNMRSRYALTDATKMWALD
jgi:hypothetical protein